MYVKNTSIKRFRKKTMRMASRGTYSERACETTQLLIFLIKKKNPSR